MRLVPLLLAVALLGCPSNSTPSAPSDAVTFSDATKGKPSVASRADDEEPAPASSSQTTDQTPTLVSVGRDATVRDPRDGFLYLRAGAGTEASVLAQMPNGSAVRVQECERGTEGRRWCLVSFEGRSGWAHESGLDYRTASAPASPRRAVVQDPDGWTNLRAAPSLDAEATRIVSGTPTTVVRCVAPQGGSRSRWCEVVAHTVGSGDLDGWIAESRLRYE